MNDNENLICRLEIVADEMKDLKRYPMEASIREAIGLLKSNSSERSVQPMVSPLDDAYVILDIISEINEVAETGKLPNDDEISRSTKLWAKSIARRFKKKYKSFRLFKEN